MFDINESDIVAKIHKYQLIRGEEILYIAVQEFIAPRKLDKFIAYPILSSLTGKKEYFGYGNSEIKALQDCLSHIKNVPSGVIFRELNHERSQSATVTISDKP